MPHVSEREMVIAMNHMTGGKLPLVGSPLKMSGTPVEYRYPPPLLGQHTDEILEGHLGYSKDRILELRQSGVIV